MVGATITSLTPVFYVDDLAVSRRFYALLGFEELLIGDDGDRGGSWTFLRCGELSLLLATGGDGDERGPLQLYCQIEDVESLQERLTAAGRPFAHLGHPSHARVGRSARWTRTGTPW